MTIGEMIRYLAKVLGIPEPALSKDLGKRNLPGTAKASPQPPWHTCPTTKITGEGGLLDIYTLQLTWVQPYLKLDENRPTWAITAAVGKVSTELRSAPGSPGFVIISAIFVSVDGWLG